jgi:hypothetical protein
MSQPLIKSNRQLIRIWYEFLQLSYEMPHLSDNLKKSRAYYRKWGTKNEILTTKFDQWWKDHKDLFEGVDLRESDTISKDPLNLNVVVPIDAPIKESLRNFEKLLRKKKRETKDLKREYAFSKDKNRIDGLRLYEILMIFRFWQTRDRPSITRSFLERLDVFFLLRKNARWTVSDLSKDPKYLKSDDGMRTLRRTIKIGEKIATNVSQGVFPGNYR